MPGFVSFILNLLLFLISLCFLICLHELGHLTMAKLFKVYCYEYSIGMGPLIYQHVGTNKKTGNKRETKFSIRALPIGGYVAMAGDEDEEQNLTNAEVQSVPKERTLNGIHWVKQVAIMIAGVTVNFILGFLFFFISYTCCPQYNYASNQVIIMKDSLLISETINEGAVVRINSIQQVVTRSDGTVIEIYDPTSESVDTNKTTFTTDSYTDISTVLSYATYNNSEDGVTFLPLSAQDIKTINMEITLEDGTIYPCSVNVEAVEYENDETIGEDYTWGTIGISVTKHYLGFVEGTKTAGVQFANGVTALFRAIGSLFTTTEAWSQTGGIIAVFQLSEQAVSLGVGVFFSYWGLISVNLAIFNLLPFPGLDGWQIVVAVIEGISHKKIPSKAKTIVSWVGMVLLFGLMAVLLVKDIIGLF